MKRIGAALVAVGLSAWSVSLLAATASPGAAPSGKKVICIDAPVGNSSDVFLYNHEGYERALGLDATDIITIDGSLTDCLDDVEDCDELVIIAHGTEDGESFAWGGTIYDGFGAGTDKLPLPADFGNLMNVTVRFCSCWSAKDPDGAGADKSMTDKLVEAMGGAAAGHSASGFTDFACADVRYDVAGGTQAQADAAIACLDADSSWMVYPPSNRPGADPNQQTKAQEIVDACAGAGGQVTVTIPSQVGSKMPHKAGYVPPENVTGDPAAGGAVGCACTGLPGCGFGGSGGGMATGVVPALDARALALLAVLFAVAGAWLLRR